MTHSGYFSWQERLLPRFEGKIILQSNKAGNKDTEGEE